jgi:flagellar biosynthetic protein FliO
MVKRRFTSAAHVLIAVSCMLTDLGVITPDARAQNTIRANTARQAKPTAPKTTALPSAEQDDNLALINQIPAQLPDSSTTTNDSKANLKLENPDNATPPPTTPSIEEQPLGQRTAKIDNLPSDPRQLAQMPSPWRTLGSLLIVLALMIAAAYIFKRFFLASHRKGSSAGIEIIARNTISPKQSLCLVQLGRHLLLLGLSPNHITSLQTIDDPEDIAHILGLLEKDKSHSISSTFTRLFQHENQYYDQEENIDDNDHSDNNPEFQYRQSQHWYQAKGELSALLDKVKGLARIRFRS